MSAHPAVGLTTPQAVNQRKGAVVGRTHHKAIAGCHGDEAAAESVDREQQATNAGAMCASGRNRLE
jgi:hypothetical protein